MQHISFPEDNASTTPPSARHNANIAGPLHTVPPRYWLSLAIRGHYLVCGLCHDLSFIVIFCMAYVQGSLNRCQRAQPLVFGKSVPSLRFHHPFAWVASTALSGCSFKQSICQRSLQRLGLNFMFVKHFYRWDIAWRCTVCCQRTRSSKIILLILLMLLLILLHIAFE